MTLMTKPTKFLQRLSCTWLVLWLIAIPLIHIHPEADHAHGAQHHQHGGLFHAVFSQDLACEFHNHHVENSQSADILVTEDSGCEHAHAHQLTHDEIAFSLLSGSFNDSLTDHDSPLFFASIEPRLLNSQLNHPDGSLKHPPPSQLLGFTHHIRPPPIFSV